MKASVASAALLFLAGAPVAVAQSAPQAAPPVQTPAPIAAPAHDFTRDLNSGPPVAATYLAPAPTPAPAVAPAPTASAPAAAPPPRAAAPTPAPTMTAPRPVSSTAAPAAATPRPAAPTPTPAPAAAAPVAAAPAPAAPPPAAPSVPTVTVLDAAARAALPFTVDLPSGFQIVTGRPGPDFRIYTIRRGESSFVMVYAGPASQFPIYSGEQVTAGGRTSVIVTENGQRHALEHLFQRPQAPSEIHVWTTSLDGADRALAERIAQSIDLR